MEANKNIHPVSARLVPRSEREQLLGQKSKAIWMTGLSGSGKSTLAIALQDNLHRQGKLVYVLDGDNIRAGLNSNLGFSEEDRRENIRRIAEVARLFVDAGVLVICSFVSPTKELREIAASIIGKDDFLEVYINASLEECEKRDVKGLYAKARSGEIKDFTGIHQPFEVPENPALEIETGKQTEAESLALLIDFTQKNIR